MDSDIRNQGIAALRRVLERLRSEKQDGYTMYQGNDRWSFVATHVEVTTAELNALFALAGICPDPVVPKGTCETCKFGPEHRGWKMPCCGCAPTRARFCRPRRAHWA